MHAKPQTTPDTILAHVRVLRLTDRLLDVAQELRQARDKLQTLMDGPTSNDGQRENHAANANE